MMRRWSFVAGLALLGCSSSRAGSIDGACTEGASVACGEVVSASETSLECTRGFRTCTGGRWGACSNEGRVVEGWSTPKTLGTPTGCASPCDPGCRKITDDAVGVDAGAGTATTPDGGLTLAKGEAGCPEKACVGLACKLPTCSVGATTSVSGKVYDPAGKNALYNVVVFVPNGPLEPFKAGASCERCTNGTSSVLATTTTGPDGSFKLTGVPAGTNIPIVLQVGRWRRLVVLPSVAPCVDNPITDRELTRLPKNKSEGDIPRMAIASGDADPFECLLTKIGLDLSEFTPEGGNGRVHFYVSNGYSMTGATPASNLWGSLDKLSQYDLVFLPCEGAENMGWKPTTIRNNLIDYTNLGGRLFTTHYGYVWMYYAPKEWGGVANWSPGSWSGTSIGATIDTSFPKGDAFSKWMVNVGASTTPSKVTLADPRRDLVSVKAGAQRWMRSTVFATNDFEPHMTFNTPFGASADKQCGRVVFSDFHVSASALTTAATFPSSCKTGDLSPQEKALEFMLFDLSSCIEPDTEVSSGSPPYPAPITFTRDYEATCATGERATWRFFDWKTTTPADSQITFAAQTADTVVGLATATPLVDVGAAYGAPITTWTGADVGQKLAIATGVSPLQASKQFLRINVTLWPSSDGYSAPVLDAWRQSYTCGAYE